MCRVLLEKLTGLQLVKKFPAFHGTRKFINALTSVRHLSLSWGSPIQSIYPLPTSWRSILILSTHLHLGLPSGLLPSGFPTTTLYTPLLTHTRHMPSPSHSSRFYHPPTTTITTKKITNNNLTASVKPSRVKNSKKNSRPLKMGVIGCLEMPVRNYHCTLRTIPEVRSSDENMFSRALSVSPQIFFSVVSRVLAGSLALKNNRPVSESKGLGSKKDK